MLLTLLRSNSNAGYTSYFVWHWGGAGAFTVTVSPALFASRPIVIGSGVY